MLAATPTVRLAQPGDEVGLARLGNRLNVEMGQDEGAHTAELPTSARWASRLIDMIVDPAVRGGGLGRLLMAELARLVQACGDRSLTWGVLNANRGAIKFYQELGAFDAEARNMELKGEALAAVAARD